MRVVVFSVAKEWGGVQNCGMSSYAIGDIQGCYKSLKELLRIIRFDPKKDTLYLAGDLVNRGPKSLQAVEWAMDLGKSAQMVLGNHELYVLAMYYGKTKKRDMKYLAPIFESDSVKKMMQWLREKPLLIKKAKNIIVHAGILPSWSIEDAEHYADEAHIALTSDKVGEVLDYWASHSCRQWRKGLKGVERLATILNVLTRIRFCSDENTMDLKCKLSPKMMKGKIKPWYAMKGRKNKDAEIIFGHWASLGQYHGHDVHCIDTGCVWGERLTALELSGGQVISVKAQE